MTESTHTDRAAIGSRNYPSRWLRRSTPAGDLMSEERAVWVAMNVRLDEGRAITSDEISQTRAAWHIRQAQMAAGVQPERSVRTSAPASATTSAAAALARVLALRT